MNKKFLSAILFGALMVTSTGTFVSCKDYDDDIENLQSQINNLATKSEVEAKLSQLQAAVDAAKAEALKAAASAEESAEIAALEAKINALETCKCDVDAMMKTIQDAVDADMAGYKAEIEALVAQVEELVGKVADFVTSVELVSSETLNGAFPRVLDFMTITEKANIFEEDITGAIEFVKDKQTQIATSSLLVRVSPTNAVLTPEMVSLVNSKGQNLDEYVDIKVSAHTDLLTTTRAAGNNGLWKLTVTLKEKNDKAFAAIKATDDGNILYAVQVNNALKTAEARYVTSGYDVKLGESKNFKPANVLNFSVTDAYGKEFKVSEINNRYGNTSKSLKEQGKATMYKELTWATSTAKEPTPAVAGTKDNTTADKADDRSDMAVIKAVQGEPITISIAPALENQVRAIYVTLDNKANAVESAPSEWNAWNSYTYTGLNEVVEATSTTISVDKASAINDYIGFRVYAVNYDGTLVDPDGRAFYVLVGDQAQEINVVATSITPVNETLVATEAVEVKALAELGKYYFSWEMDDKDQVPFNLNFVVDDKANNVYIAPGDKSSVYTINRILKIAAKPTKKWYEYEDGKAYYGTLKAYKVVDGNEFVAATLSVSFTKNIPAGAPEGLTIKTNQVENGIYNCYLIPDSWAAKTATKGTMAMDQVFNFPATAEKAKYAITFATTNSNADAEAYTDAQIVGGDEAVVVAKSLIDDATKHATTATYNYGKISSVQYAKYVADNKVTPNYIVNVPEISFETVYNCIYNSTYTWDWATREQLHKFAPTAGWMTKDANGAYTKAIPTLTLTYGTAFDLTDIDGYIFGTSEWDAIYNTMLCGATSLSIEDVTFTSDANGKQEYFAPEFTKGGHIAKLNVLPESSNPTADVASTLTVKVKDMYGHDRVITIAAVVKPRK